MTAAVRRTPKAKRKNTKSKARLRLWIQLLRTTRAVEAKLREALRQDFAATLPQFDVMAALYRFPEGMLMSELSRYLMVSNGNVTGIVTRLVDDKLVVRTYRQGDRRTSMVKLSRQGVRAFEAMASEHENWVNGLLEEFSGPEATALAKRLRHADRARHH